MNPQILWSLSAIRGSCRLMAGYYGLTISTDILTDTHFRAALNVPFEMQISMGYLYTKLINDAVIVFKFPFLVEVCQSVCSVECMSCSFRPLHHVLFISHSRNHFHHGATLNQRIQYGQ